MTDFLCHSASDTSNCSSDAGKTFCCEYHLSDSDQFLIPSSRLTSFAFGLAVGSSSNSQLITYSNISAKFVINGYQSSSPSFSNIPLSDENRVQLGLPMLRLVIGM